MTPGLPTLKEAIGVLLGRIRAETTIDAKAAVIFALEGGVLAIGVERTVVTAPISLLKGE